MGCDSRLFKRGPVCYSAVLRRPQEDAIERRTSPFLPHQAIAFHSIHHRLLEERRDRTTGGRPTSFLGSSRAEKMEGSGRAKRRALVVSLTPPPPPPPPPPSTEGDEEEQIEKFYALLENIKAMRSHWRTSPANKRPRREEPLWQPRFVREDFNDRNEASGDAEGDLQSSKDGERKEGKEKEEGGEEESTLDLNLSL